MQYLFLDATILSFNLIPLMWIAKRPLMASKLNRRLRLMLIKPNLLDLHHQNDVLKSEY